MAKFTLRRPDDETLIILLNGREVGSANHDSDGWQGMESLEELVKGIAGVLNIPVETDNGEEEEEEEEDNDTKDEE